MLKRLAPLIVAVTACGNPDNQILGSLSANPSTGAPLILFENIRSAIHNRVNLTDPKTGARSYASAVILSDRADLCTVLKDNPAYFQKPSDQFIALAIFTPDDMLGTFYAGQNADKNVNYTELLAGKGAGATTQGVYPVQAGYIAVTNWDVSGGANATGSFDLIFYDAVTQLNQEFVGRFKTTTCDALANASLP